MEYEWLIALIGLWGEASETLPQAGMPSRDCSRRMEPWFAKIRALWLRVVVLAIKAVAIVLAWRVVHGGDTRHQSVANALAQVDPATEIVLVHDAVRPFVTPEQIDRVIAEARTRGAAILGIPAIDTVKEVKRASLPEDVALVSATIPRERIVLAQTPQAFSYSLLRDAFRKAEQDGATASDEAAIVERFGHDVFVVLGSERNLKITRPADMDLARFYLDQERRKLSS